MRPLSLVFCGSGSRARTYAGIAAEMPDRYQIAAAADPVAERVAVIQAHAVKVPAALPFKSFSSATELFAAGKLGDVCVIGTQDSLHREHSIRALELGYDLLLEKPIAPTLEDTEAVAAVAQRLGRRVVVCHVLRYTSFYSEVRRILDAGEIGQLISVNAIEGVQPWHQAHSFVRGHWSVKAKSSPMILAKSCHDMDILAWLVGSPFTHLASRGALTHFRSANAPAGAPARCSDGCPVGDTCRYNAALYAKPEGRRWLGMVYDRAKEATDAEIIEWTRTSPWGRCVYRCDNDVVDHQVLSLQFANAVTATFTMTAFDEGRQLELFGTEGWLRGGSFVKKQMGCDLIMQRHGWNQEPRRITLDEPKHGYEGHGGGDWGLMLALHDDLTCPDKSGMRTSLETSLQSHRMAFAAEEARLK